ncbi:esterase-like activity of phytase family protein [Rugamonas sp. DEMB1]|nr:esterase-like activity of phytase family protein [Rugamonas sp. DEMB1]
MVGIMQANLAQDAKGTVRIVTIDIATKATHEYAYQLSTGSGVSEIVALNDHQFLVDERDGKGLGDGSKAVAKQLFMIDLNGAASVDGVARLNAASPSVSKSLFLDLVPLLKANGYAANQIPAKIEGLAFGADVTINGVLNHTLYVANDNDFSAGAGDNKFFVFGVTDADLAKAGASYVPQAISTVPEASSYAMFLAGLCMIGLTVRRERSEIFKA